MLIDQLPSEGPTWDLCVVGSGPVGMALAMESEQLGHQVLVLESGDLAVNPSIADASRAEIVNQHRHAPLELAVCRALGGTSWTWGGRCVAYNEVDWMDRDFVPNGHWPIRSNEVSPWYRSAAKYLLCGNDSFEIPYPRKLTNGLTLHSVERWATESRLILKHRETLLGSSNIKISLKSTVNGLRLSSAGDSVASISVHTPAGERQVRAKQIILAIGGVETTRLLLHFQRSYDRLFGGTDGPLGRFYMGHISGKIASIQLEDPNSIADYDFLLDASGAFYRRRFMLSTETQLKHQVLNTVFWPDNPPFYDASHRSGVLSSTFLALAFPPTGRRLLPDAIRLGHTGPKPYDLAGHLRNAILGAPAGALDMYRILRDRLIRKPRKPGFLVRNKGGKYALHYHAEQVPDPKSRIRLTKELDAFGVHRAQIDLRFTEQDVDSVISSHELLDESLRANHIGKLEFWYPGNKLRERIWEMASDGYHQVGSARMGVDPLTSVVDSNLRVHGLSNLYVASSAVFPTTSSANSTFLAVALGIRLAHHVSNLNRVS